MTRDRLRLAVWKSPPTSAPLGIPSQWIVHILSPYVPTQPSPRFIGVVVVDDAGGRWVADVNDLELVEREA